MPHPHTFEEDLDLSDVFLARTARPSDDDDLADIEDEEPTWWEEIVRVDASQPPW